MVLRDHRHTFTLIMIKANSIFGKLNLINSSDQQLFEHCLADFKVAKQPCPHCGAIGCFSNAAPYTRSLITVRHGKRHQTPVVVPRLLCNSCNHSHAILPDCLIPFGSYSVRFVLHVLLAYLTRNCTVVSLCERWQISISTLYDWIHLFSKHHSLWFGVMKKIHWISTAALSLIQDTPELLSGFRQRYGFSFLQRMQTTHSPPSG